MAFAVGAIEGAGAAEGAAAGEAVAAEAGAGAKGPDTSKLFGSNPNQSLAQSIIGNPAKVFEGISAGAAGIREAAANMPKYDPQSNAAGS